MFYSTIRGLLCPQNGLQRYDFFLDWQTFFYLSALFLANLRLFFDFFFHTMRLSPDTSPMMSLNMPYAGMKPRP